jgi:hypothetical protein
VACIVGAAFERHNGHVMAFFAQSTNVKVGTDFGWIGDVRDEVENLHRSRYIAGLFEGRHQGTVVILKGVSSVQSGETSRKTYF